MNETYKKFFEGGNLITGKSFNVSFSTATDAMEMESLVREIRSSLGIKKRSSAVLEIVKLARETLDRHTAAGEKKIQLSLGTDSELRWFAEGFNGSLRVLTKKVEAFEREIRTECEAKERLQRESLQALNDKMGILQEEKKLLEAYVAVLQAEVPDISKPDIDQKVLAHITGKTDKGGGMAATH